MPVGAVLGAPCGSAVPGSKGRNTSTASLSQDFSVSAGS